MNPHSPKILSNVEVKPEHVTPLYDNLLVRRILEDESTSPIIDPRVTVTKGGLWRPKADTGPRRGVVVRMGRGDKRKHPGPCICGKPAAWDDMRHLKGCPGYMRVSMDVQVGDTIIYPRFESSHVLIDGQEYTFVREGDVMAVLEEGPEGIYIGNGAREDCTEAVYG